MRASMPAVHTRSLTGGEPSTPARSLTLPGREEIRAGIERGEPVGVIAGSLGRHRCTVNVEINRNGGRARSTATAAQQRAESERARPKDQLLVADPVMAAHITARLEAKDSP
jgi:IS30 family transposase